MLKTILIVDDRVINLEFLAMLLDFVGYRVIKAANGAEALDLARIDMPALVITDIIMPVMDGIELVNQLHADATTAHIPIIFYTATYSAREVGLMADALTIAAVLIKPSDPQEILDLVAKTLGKAPAPYHGSASTSVPPALAPPQHRLPPTLPAADDTLPELPAYPPFATGSMPTLSLRLAALLELSVTLSTERNAQRLLVQFCRTARNIMNVTHAAVGMHGSGGLRCRASCGLPAGEIDDIFDILEADGGSLRQHLAGGATLDMHTTLVQPELRTLGPPHVLRRAFLIVPIRPRSGPQGWFYMAGKLGSDDFNVADREFATTLSVQLASLYENLSLFEEAQEHVSRLEAEVYQRKLVVDKLQQSEAGLRRAQILTKSAHIILGEDNVFESWSKTLPHLVGVSEADMPKTLEAWIDIMDPAEQANFRWSANAAGHIGRRMEVGYQLRRRSDGATIELHHVIEPLRSHTDATTEKRWFHTIQDITEQKLQQRKVARLSRFFAVLSGINSAIVRIHDSKALFQEACRIAVSLGGFGVAWIATIDPDTLDGEVLVCASIKSGHTEKIRFTTRPGMPSSDAPWSVAARDMRLITCNNIGTDATLLPHRETLLDSGHQSLAAFPLILEGRALAVMTLFSHEIGSFDVEELKLLDELAGDLSFGLRYIDKEEKLNYLAYYDVLTGLPNKMLFQDRLTQILQGAHQHSDVVCVVLLDLDHFSQLNDVRGRHAGDQVLVQVANRLRATLDDSFSLARIGADVFAIAVFGKQHAVVASLEQQIFAALHIPLIVDLKEISVTARAGFALSPSDGRNAETLFKHAEIALKNAKSSGQHYLYYAPQMNAAVAAKAALKAELKLALDTKQFVVHYQPRVDLVSGRIVSAEALIRWRHPQRGMVPPDQFIPMAEENGLILAIGAWVIDAVCAQQAAWLAQGVVIVPVAVNLSGVQLNKGLVLNTIDEVINRYQLEAKYIEFELTESVVMSDPEEATRNLQILKDKGIKLALDDFGTGYSSLAYLKHFPFDFVKIDRAFITDITKSAKDAMIATAVIAMGHSLNLRVVAEGVETEEQLDYLRRHGCDEIQGYYFSRPVSASAFEIMLREDKRLIFAETPAVIDAAGPASNPYTDAPSLQVSFTL